MSNVPLWMRIWHEVSNFAWHRRFSLQRCCKTFCLACFYQPALCRMCVFVLWTSCLRVKKHYYYMWPFAKKLYHGRLNKHDDVIEWHFMKIASPPKWRAGCAPDSPPPSKIKKIRLAARYNKSQSFCQVKKIRWLPQLKIKIISWLRPWGRTFVSVRLEQSRF